MHIFTHVVTAAFIALCSEALRFGYSHKMAANDVEGAVDLKNGLLSFSNPNYHIDDAVNCNTAASGDLYEDLYQELDSVCNFKQRSSVKNRRNYANLDIGSMGIDINNDPATSLENQSLTTTTTTTNTDSDTNRNASTNLTASNVTMGASCDNADNERTNSRLTLDQTSNGLLDYYINVDSWNHSTNRLDLIENANPELSNANMNTLQCHLKEESPDSNSNDTGSSSMDLNSPDSMDTATTEETPLIPHIPGQLNNDLYAVLVKRNKGDQNNGSSSKPSTPSEDKKDKDTSIPEILPPGWERHEDNDGPYYWHIKSGTIQREPPPPMPPNLKEIKTSISKDSQIAKSTSSTSLSTSTLISSVNGQTESAQSKEAFKRQSYPRVEQDSREKAIRFAVRSLGWVEIAEEDLTPERSSKAVNKCIVDLSLGRNDILDVVGRWGDGKDLFMDLDDYSLKLIDPENLTVLNTQPIHTIRVWGVGRDNGRDFAYVARDRVTRKHMCHVFRCDTPARTIANTLRDICKKIMIERSLTQNLGKSVDTNKNGGNGNMVRSGLTRPTNLPTEHRRIHSRGMTTYAAQSFPTPMEEPKKVLKVHYLGMTQVNKATGMDVLNAAIEHMTTTVHMDKWQFVNVAVAPSTITICEPGEEGKQLIECRVRFLSFLGIGKNVKQCAFIVHTAQDQFVAHVFHCEPSSGALCKTIEAACKLRYQKCLDAHPPGADKKNGDSQNGKGIGAAIKNVLGTLTGRLSKNGES